MLLLVGLAVCCAASQVSAGQGFRATAPATYHRAEELVCCGSAGSIQDDPGDPGPRPEHCCGKGWGLHCCLRGFCCLDDGVVPVAAYPPERLPTPAPPVLQQARTMASLRVRGGDEFWRWKNWAEWLNLAVVILIVALVCAVLACCWRRKRRDEALRHQKRRLLRLGDDLYTYGAVRGSRPTAPNWSPPVASHWVDFAYRPATTAAPKPHTDPTYGPAPASTVRAANSSDSDIEIRPPLVFSSSDEEHRLITEFKRKTKIPG